MDIKIKDRIEEGLVLTTIKDITWERIILHMDILVGKCPEGLIDKLDFYLSSESGKVNVKFKVDRIENDRIHLSMNITNPGNNECLPDERYIMVCCIGDEAVSLPQVSMDILPNLLYKSATFMHGSDRMGYWVNFSVPEGDDLRLEVLARDMKLAEPMRRGIRIKATKGQKHAVIRSIYKTALASVNKKKTSSDKKTLLFMSEQSETLGSNLQAVLDRMEERGLTEQFEILTSARNMVGKGGYGIKNWTQVMNLVARADQIFIDDHIPFMDWLKINPRVEIIQLWHAGAGYKSSGYSRWGHFGAPAAFSCHRQYNYGITASKNIAHFFSEVFGINTEQILPTGMPRMDKYLDPKNREKVEKELYERYPVLKDKKVILFAPTYRGLNRKSAYYPYELIDFDGLYEACGEDCVVLFKMHPWVSVPVPIKDSHKDRFMDFNEYPNINDLFYITDLFITDYSSGVFEFSLMKKPMLFFAFDEHQYAFSRGFHREYRPAAPGKVVNDFDEVLKAIREEDYEFYKNEEYLKYHFDYIDSNSSDRVIDWFILGNIPDEIRETIKKIDDENARIAALDFSDCNLFMIN